MFVYLKKYISSLNTSYNLPSNINSWIVVGIYYIILYRLYTRVLMIIGIKGLVSINIYQIVFKILWW